MKGVKATAETQVICDQCLIPVGYCDWCGKMIKSGDTIYCVNGIHFCEECGE